MSFKKVINLSRLFEKKAQYAGPPYQPELNQENIRKEVMRVAADELAGMESYIHSR